LQSRRAGNAESAGAAGRTLSHGLVAQPACAQAAQWNVAAKMPKAAAMSATTVISISIEFTPGSPAMMFKTLVERFDPDQIAILDESSPGG
jgi:hypothetical protein